MARRPVEESRHTGVTPRVTTVPVSTAVRLVTLEDPTGGLRKAKGAFCRLRPGIGHTPEEIESWRDSVARVALAVKILPSPKAADVPAASHRPDYKVGTFREETMKIVNETENKDAIKLVKTILDKVGA